MSEIPQTIFGEPWHDTSLGILRTEADGSILIGQYDYSSDIIAVFRCSNEDTVQWFAHRFFRGIDTWHDVFLVGPIAHFTLKHRPPDGDGDIDDQITSEINLSFAGWLVTGDDNTLHPDLDAAIEANNLPGPAAPDEDDLTLDDF